HPAAPAPAVPDGVPAAGRIPADHGPTQRAGRDAADVQPAYRGGPGPRGGSGRRPAPTERPVRPRESSGRLTNALLSSPHRHGGRPMTDASALEFRRLAPPLEQGLAEFFTTLAAAGDDQFFHPHPFTPAEAARLCGYGRDLYYAA